MTFVLSSRLANGTSIHTISALLLQLVQACAFGVTDRVRKIRSTGSVEEPDGQKTSERADALEEEIRLCIEVMDSSLSPARAVAGYLFQRQAHLCENRD